MPLTRHFLGWDAPVVETVGDFLLPHVIEGPVSLADTLVVVPTRHAGRRLRERLAWRCAQSGSSLLADRVVTPAYFTQTGPLSPREASPAESLAAWCSVLLREDTRRHTVLFPSGPPGPDWTSALRTAVQLQAVRTDLCDGGYAPRDVPRKAADVLEEPERWRQLHELELSYLEQLKQAGVQDGCLARRMGQFLPPMPDGIERIVLAAVPDPTELALDVLRRLSDALCIEVLIAAPPGYARRFDAWGRPRTRFWSETNIPIPEPQHNLLSASTPADQGARVLEVMAAESGRVGPADVAVGVPDPLVIPFLEDRLHDSGLATLNPAGTPLAHHPLVQALRAFHALSSARSYDAFARLLRQADILRWLRDDSGIEPAALLAELDVFQNHHMPCAWEDVRSRFPGGTYTGSCKLASFAGLARAVTRVDEWLRGLESRSLDDAVRAFLKCVYGHRILRSAVAADRAFGEAAAVVDELLRSLDGSFARCCGLTAVQSLDLLLDRLGRQSVVADAEAVRVDLEGWLELCWEDAPLLIVTGMNEGAVPDGRLADAYLPDRLRRALGLRDDAQRFARDAFLMSVMIRTRRRQGRIVFIAGRSGAAGDPLKPSRLLFRCPRRALPQRVRRLFAPLPERAAADPPGPSFTLVPPREREPDVARFPVTRFRDFLSCPFRYYLAHVLGMQPVEDDRRELDALEFGSLMHDALQELGRDPGLRGETDPEKIAERFEARAAAWVEERFGDALPFAVSIQLEAARARLAAAARLQAHLAAEGWEIQEAEQRVELQIGGMRVTGQIDRVDRHAESGKIRILDYKTFDRIRVPADAHLAPGADGTPAYAQCRLKGRLRRWVDLQLPLYVHMRACGNAGTEPPEVGYFALPRSAADSRVLIWEELDEPLRQSAMRCAEGVLEAVRERHFWPPATRVEYDRFEPLFPFDPRACVDRRAFLENMQA